MMMMMMMMMMSFLMVGKLQSSSNVSYKLMKTNIPAEPRFINRFQNTF